MQSIDSIKHLETASPSSEGEGTLQVLLRRGSGEPVLAREPVTRDDLKDARSEVWRDCFLRKGRPDMPPTAFTARVVPIPGATPGGCRGYAIETGDPSPETAGRCEFSIYSLAAVASRAADRLRASGVLQAGEECFYDLRMESASADREAALASTETDESGRGAFMAGHTECSPLKYLSVPLPPLLAQGRAEGIPHETFFPVFFTEEAFASAERFSRKGAAINPAFESGGVLAGPLCSCPETGEFFAVVSSVLEVQDAKQAVVSLEYTSTTWAQIQRIIRAQQSVHPAIRNLGQCHGHSFLPNSGQTCAECLSREICTLSNLFVSQEDRSWSRAVFSGQPWQLCQIFGLTARGDKVRGLFTLHDGQLLQRGFHILPDFELDKYETRTAQRQTING